MPRRRQHRRLIAEPLECRLPLDGAGTLTVLDIGASEVSGRVNFNVRFDGSFPGGFSVAYSTANDSAWSGTDYVATSGSLEFSGSDGEVQSAWVDLINLSLVEGTEQFKLDLGAVTPNGPGTVTIADGTGVATITDDDQAIVSINAIPASAPEGSAGNTHLVDFQVSLDHLVDVPVQVDFEIPVTGSALASDGDFVATSGTLSLTSSISHIYVTVNGDAKTELDEWFTLWIDNLQAQERNVVFASGEDHEFASHTIANDDQATITITVASVTVSEGAGTAVIEAQLVGEVDHEIDVSIQTNAGTASGASGDYVALPTNWTFSGASNETKSYSVTINDDNVVEANLENFTVSDAILDAGGRDVVLGRSVATVIIDDNDQSQISINNVTANEGTSPTGWTQFVFTVTLSKPIDTAITIDYHTVSVSATGTGNLDYFNVSPPAMITIPANTTYVSITILVRPDSAVEPNETFKVILDNLVAPGRDVVIADDEGIGTITNDD